MKGYTYSKKRPFLHNNKNGARFVQNIMALVLPYGSNIKQDRTRNKLSDRRFNRCLPRGRKLSNKMIELGWLPNDANIRHKVKKSAPSQEIARCGSRMV